MTMNPTTVDCHVWIPNPREKDPHHRCEMCGRARDRHDLIKRDDGSLMTNVERRA